MVPKNRLSYGTGFMFTPQAPRPVAGLFAGALPVLLPPFSLTLFILQQGGSDKSLYVLGMMREPWGLFVWLSLACTLGLAATLYFLGSGHEVPLLLPVTLALLPWVGSIGLGLYHLQGIQEFVAQLDLTNQINVLVVRASDPLWMLLLGTWTTATLLVACVGGLLINGVGSLNATEEGTASTLIPRTLEALVLLLVVGVGLTHISEDRGLAWVLEEWSVLFMSVREEAADQFALGVKELSGIALLRPWALRALALGMGAMGVYQLTRRPRDFAGLAALGTLALLVAGTLWANSRVLPRLERFLEAVLQPRLVPPEFRLLPFGGEGWPANQVDVIVTAHELTGPAGTRLEWSAGDQPLAGFLRDAYEEVERRPARLMRKQDSLIKGDWNTLTLALEERVTTQQFRRLLAASSAAKLHGLILLTQRNPDHLNNVSRQLRSQLPAHPFLQRLVTLMDARPGSVEVNLPWAFKAVQATRYSPAPPVWVGEVGTEREVRLSRWPLREGQEERVLSLSGPEEPAAPPVHPVPHLYLQVKEEAALIDVAHAIRRARAHRFMVILTLTPPPGEFPEP